jgi:hypothetical protein
MFTVYRQCSCGSHSINISAVNRCDSPGESTLLIIDHEDEASVFNMMEHQSCTRIVATTGSVADRVNSDRNGMCCH